MSEKVRGKIKFYHSGGHYGFIVGTTGDEYYFREVDLHKSVTALNPDDKVEFNLVSSMKGPRAVGVKKVEEGK